MVNLAQTAALCYTITTLICGLTSLLQLCVFYYKPRAIPQRYRKRCLEMLTFSSICSSRVTKRKVKDNSGFGLGELRLQIRVWSNLAPTDEAQRPENEIALTSTVGFNGWIGSV